MTAQLADASLLVRVWRRVRTPIMQSSWVSRGVRHDPPKCSRLEHGDNVDATGTEAARQAIRFGIAWTADPD